MSKPMSYAVVIFAAVFFGMLAVSKAAEFTITSDSDITIEQVGDDFVVSSDEEILLTWDRVGPVEWINEPSRPRSPTPLDRFVRQPDVYQGDWNDAVITGTWLEQPPSYYD